MFSTHPQLEGPGWICSCFECPRRSWWSRSGSRGTTGTTRWPHSPWHKGLHKPPPRDGGALSTGDVALLHLEQMKQDRQWREAQLGSVPTACTKQTDFTSNVHLPVEYATEQHVVRLQAAKCNTGTMILKIYSGKQRRKKLGVWHLGCSPLSEAGKRKEQDHFINRKL